MGGKRAVTVVAALALVPGRAAVLPAQALPAPPPAPAPLLAVALQDLTFVEVFPGIPRSVFRHDPRHAGLFELQGPPEASVRVEFVLPTALLANDGTPLPILFGPEDAFADFSRGRPPRGRPFDPHGPAISTLGPNGRLYLRLGGTVQPAPLQPGGTYRATIVMTVYDLGT
jgi:hypothetical protein